MAESSTNATTTSAAQSKVNAGRLIAFLFGWIASSIALGWLTFRVLAIAAPIWSHGAGPTVVIVAEVYLLLIAAMLCAANHGLRRFHFTSLHDIGLGFVLWLSVLAASALFYWAITPWIGPLPQTLRHILQLASDAMRLPSADTATLFFILVRACILVPIAEEMLFRGVIFGVLRRRLSAGATISISAALFALMHAYPLLFPLVFFFGLASAWLREKTGSSFNFVVAHALNSTLFFTAAWILYRHT
jgi:membrane protease YdiL (CAAX protease family)